MAIETKENVRAKEAAKGALRKMGLLPPEPEKVVKEETKDAEIAKAGDLGNPPVKEPLTQVTNDSTNGVTVVKDDKSAFDEVQDFIAAMMIRDDAKIVGHGWNERPPRGEEFRDWPERYQEVITIKVLIKREIPKER